MLKKKIAVIGSGISGLSASLFLSSHFDVFLLEKNNYLGGHTRTINIKESDKDYDIDTGFVVFNKRNYPNLEKFFNFLNVETDNSNMSFSLSFKNPNLEYGGSGFKAIFAQHSNFFSLKFLSLINEIRKLYNDCNRLSLNDDYNDFTLESYLNKKNYSQELRDYHIYPMISSIWSSNKEDIKNFPLISFINFFKNHGLFDFKNRPQWKYVTNGSKSYIEKLISKKKFNYKINYFVEKIIRKNNKIIIINKNKEEIVVDYLVIATHADQALLLLDNPSEKEKKILSQFKYTKNEAFLHSDETFMPKRKAAWSSWNFIGNDKNDSNFSLTYWMNNLQKINSSNNYLVTINPVRPIKNYYDSTIFEHPIYNLDTLKAQKTISSIQGYLNTFYCGSYCGYGFHEDGIQSAAYIANMLNIRLPWNEEKQFENRLSYNDKVYE